jgi:hypothetical protein
MNSNSSDPADPSARKDSRSASRHFSILMVRFGLVIVLVAISILVVRLVLTPGLFGNKPYQVNVTMEGTSAPSAQSQVVGGVTPEEVRRILAEFIAQQKVEKERRDVHPSSVPAEAIQGDPSHKAGAASSDAAQNPDDTAVSSTRMVFIRVGDAEVGQKGDNKSKDYYIPAGTDHLSRGVCGKAIVKGLVAVSRKPGLRAKVLLPSDKKIGIIPDWRVWGLFGSGGKVVDVAIPTDGEYVKFDEWAKAKEVRFYWTTDAAEGNNDPLVIRVYKE